MFSSDWEKGLSRLNHELKEMLQAVVQEALKPVREELQSLKTEFQAHKAELQSLKAGQERHGEWITQLIGIVGATNEKVTAMEARMTTMEAKMATKDDVAEIPAMKAAIFETADAVKSIKDTLENHEHTLNALSRRSIDQEQETLQNTRKLAELTEIQKSIHEILGDHEVEIRTLKRQSV